MGDSAEAAAVIVDGDDDLIGGQGVVIRNKMKADDEHRKAGEEYSVGGVRHKVIPISLDVKI